MKLHSCYEGAIFASSVTTFPNKKEFLRVLWITIKKNLFKMTMLHFWPFISLPTIKEFTLKSPTFCNCLRARTALKPGLNYKVLLTKLFQSQAWKNHTLNWYRYASNTLCIDARIPLLAWLMSLKKVVEEKRLLSPVCIFPLVQLRQQSLCIMDQWFPNFL